MTRISRIAKRSFDIVGAICALAVSGPIILCAAAVARWDTEQSGFFRHTRVGLYGHCFELLKLRTMRDVPNWMTTVTTSDDPRITRWGRFLRRSKLDELPQLINVLRGEMSFVGPRPDVPAQWEQVPQSDKSVLLSVRPGITGPASLKYRNEEALLAAHSNAESFNRTVIFPDKVRINKQYVANYSFGRDLLYLVDTFLWKGISTSASEPHGTATREMSVEFTHVTRRKENEHLPAKRAA